MIERRKRWFFRLAAMLRALEGDTDNLELLRELNGRLIARIMYEERYIRAARDRLRGLTDRLKTARLPKAAATDVRNRIATVREHIDTYFGHLFIWRSIGDAIAFLYLDKFSIKHAYFDTGSLGIKSEAGFLTGKDGFLLEVGLLLEAIDRGVPAILCDITTTLRHGDVCLLGGSDPVLIEVKQGKKLNQRGKRQAAKLAKLEEFLEQDSAPNFRGFQNVQRVSLGVPPRDNVPALNACIAQARRDGFAMFEAEAGISFAVVADPKAAIEPVFPKGDASRFLAVDFNENKNDRQWAPYVPFMLTLRDPDDLYDFILGDLYIMAFIDADILCTRIAPPGWTARMIDHEGYLVEVSQDDGDGRTRISRQFVLRLAFECASLGWMAELENKHIDNLVRVMTAAEGSDDVDPAYAHLRARLLSTSAMNAEEILASADAPPLFPSEDGPSASSSTL